MAATWYKLLGIKSNKDPIPDSLDHPNHFWLTPSNQLHLPEKKQFHLLRPKWDRAFGRAPRLENDWTKEAIDWALKNGPSCSSNRTHHSYPLHEHSQEDMKACFVKRHGATRAIQNKYAKNDIKASQKTRQKRRKAEVSQNYIILPKHVSHIAT